MNGAPINSNGIVLPVGEVIEVTEAVGKEMVRRYAFLSYSTKEVVKVKKLKKVKPVSQEKESKPMKVKKEVKETVVKPKNKGKK